MDRTSREPEPAGVTSDAVIQHDVMCASCGYNLKGLPVEGECPECGLPAWDSVQRIVDPKARSLPQLRNPRGVGAAMVWLTSCLLLAALAWVSRPLALAIDSFGWTAWHGRVPTSLRLLTSVLAIAAGWSVLKLAPPRRSESSGTISRDLWLLTIGLVLLAGAAAVGWWWLGADITPLRWGSPMRIVLQHAIVHGSLLVGFGVVMLGMRGVFHTIGKRSRQYRTGRGGRQRAADMLAAGAGILVGEGLRLLGVAIQVDVLFTVGTVIAATSALMLVIGLAYMVLNAFWIRRSLRRPPPSLAQVLGAPGAEPPEPPADG